MKLILRAVLVCVSGVNSLPQSGTSIVTKMKTSPDHQHQLKPSQWTAWGNQDAPIKTPILQAKASSNQVVQVHTPLDASREKYDTYDGKICRCGQTNEKRIINGWDVKPAHKYPWQVGIRANNSENYMCGGSIINNRYILTAAHCVTDDNGEQVSSYQLSVGIGDHISTFTEDDRYVTKAVGVEQIIVHHDYNSKTFNKDIALLKLFEPMLLRFYPEVGTICLPANDDKTYENMYGTASGWGVIKNDGPQAEVLQEMILVILDSNCKGFGTQLTENQLCVLPDFGDTCQGDSGGPLVVFEGSHYTLVGITSFTFGKCYNINHPTVFTRVSKFLQWIEDNTKDGLSC
ncbi:hypothetical protein Pmani_001440 [Petrolisthes manimaculis]|uniref:Peptidase S1 domain-containing protein n=1 Tax=Petrolisthes manimaculis TaxID=1843537 RepID=A0AAE1QKJ6_9EUCA|nr:hypothetical protein Pmani_001440 [Petrolisthes manimaculis]